MIKTLRRKLVIAAMASLVAVLVLLMGSVAMLNYAKIVSDADGTLELLAHNDGRFPALSESHDGGKGEKEFLRELPFETRYFFVMLGEHGDAEKVNIGKIAAIDAPTAVEYAQEVWASGKDRGFIGQYRYLSVDQSEGSMVVFIDCGRNLASFRTLVVTSIAVSFGGTVLVLLLLLLVSHRMVKPFSENYEKQKRFITDAGHELKTPLTIIDANTEILAMDYGENECLSEIQNQTRRLAELTEDLIFLSRAEETRATQVSTFSLSDVAQHVVQSFDGVAATNGKRMEQSIQPNLMISGDEPSIQKLIGILLDNAIKYSTQGSVISCQLTRQKHHLLLTVHNQTQQISKEQTAHLFDRFYRTDTSRNSDTGGYGLGLSIAKAIVTAHGGRIAASTADERSLTVAVSFPVR